MESELKPCLIMTDELRELIIAARVVAFEDFTEENRKRLDKASEKFAECVAWHDEPDDNSGCKHTRRTLADQIKADGELITSLPDGERDILQYELSKEYKENGYSFTRPDQIPSASERLPTSIDLGEEIVVTDADRELSEVIMR